MNIMKERIRNVLKSIDKSKKIQLVFFVCCMTCLFGFYSLINYNLKGRFEIIPDDYIWVYQVDEITNKAGELTISGFAFVPEYEAATTDYSIIMYNSRTGKKYYPRMDFCSREDVNAYFLCDYDYTESGFVATISSKKLDLENEVYEILLRPKGFGKAYSTGVYYANGEIMHVDPKKFTPLETNGTDLEEITTEGVLRAYRPDFGIYVYQYDGDLYWIAEPYYVFDEKDTYIEIQMDTTQIEKLPEDRLAKQWYWGNIGFQFSDNELIDWNTGKYRVAKCALPIEYSITKMWTGNYKGEWIWKQYFRPWYEF